MTLVIQLAERKIVRQTTRISLAVAIALIFISTFTLFSYGQTAQTPLTRHVRQEVANGQATLVGRMPASETLKFDIVLPLRDRPGLQSFIRQQYDPASPFYHLFLTPEEVTERYGPSQEDWDATVAFAKASGFEVLGGTRDSRDLWLTGTVANIEKAFHVTMGVYQDPTEEGRTFFATDREPTTNLPFPLWHITGLDNNSKPHPLYVKKSDYAKAHGMNPEDVVSNTDGPGSGPSSNFLGSDMRAAYYGGTALTGAGQNIGLFELAGSDLADLATYYSNIGQTEPYTPTLVSTGGYATTCLDSGGRSKACDDIEQTIDMQQAMGMAPGSTMTYMYVCGAVLASGSGGFSDSACISAMVTTTAAPLSKQIGCSWGWSPADTSTLDPYFEQMASQGQNFFVASGDSAKWSSSNTAWPADDANVVAVGGTDLTTVSAGGAWSSETAWADSGGGNSTSSIPIPSWQTPVDGCSGCSKTLRNGPDVSAMADFYFYYCGDQTSCGTGLGGTSFAAPMWAGYLALANQQAAANSETIGYINPIIYPQAELGGTTYSTLFHDITSTSVSCGDTVTTGYDLCTGWGSPNGTGLINLLAPTGGLTSQTITCSTAPPSSEVYNGSFTIACTASSGLAVTYTSSGGCSNSGATYTMTSGTTACTVDVNQSGNSSYSAAPQVAYTVTATKASQTITFTTNAPSSAAYNSQLTVAATGGASGNAVVFTSSGSCTNSGATYTMTSGTGTCSVIANQAGNTNYSAATQVTESVSATLASQTITFTTNAPASAAYNSQFTVAATATSGLAVAYTSSGSCSNSGATYTMTSGTGTCTVIANQAGNTNYSAATQVTESVSATKASQTVTFTTNAPANEVYNGNFTVAATASSTLAVAYTSSGSCSNSGATYTMTSGTGTCSVIANQAGNGNYAAATQVAQTTNATLAPQTITFTTSAPANATYGQSFTVAATGGASGNSVVFTSAGSCSNSGATYTMTSGTGTCSVIANQAGNTNYAAAAQVTQSTNATLATSSVSVGSSQNPAIFGQSVTFTATINGQFGQVKGRNGRTQAKPETVTGTVTWSTNTGCGTTTVSAGNSGTATCTTSSLPLGTDTITATYSGDSNHSGGTATLTGGEVINQYSTTTAVASTLNPATYGQSVSFTANVTSSGDTPTGTVQFNVDGSPFDTETLVSGSAASASISTLAVGTHTVTAVYSGATSYAASTGTLSGGEVVNSATAATVVTSSLNPTNYGQSVTFTATINGENGLVKGRKGSSKKPLDVTGNVTWSANTGCGTIAVTPTTGTGVGTATCTTSTLPVGTDTITATYSGDGNHSGSTGTLSGGQVVNQWSTSTAVGSSLNPSVYGQSVNFTANVTSSGGTPTGTVQFNIDGIAFGSPVTLSSGSATSTSTSTLAVGTHTVTATYSGATGYAGSGGSLSGGEVVNSATAATVVTSSLNPSAFNQSVTFTATINGEYGLVKGRRAKPNVTGTVDWSSNTGCGTTAVTSGNPGTATCATSSLPVGTNTITATYSGDSNHGGGTGTLSGGQVVDQAPATTAVTSSLNPATYGQSVSFTANVTSSAGTPTGTVQFNVDGSLFDTETLVSGSATSVSTSTLAVGTHTVTAVYSGDTNFPTSTGTLSGGEVVKPATAATVVTSGLNPSTFSQSVTFTATINGQYGLVKGRKGAKPEDVTGSVNWSSNTGCGTTTVTSGNPGTATCTTSTLVSGTDTITATYSGDSNHSGSTGTLSGGQVVNQGSTTTAVGSSLNPSTNGQAVSFTANVTSTAGAPTGTVQFSIDGTAFGSPVTLASGSATSGTTSAMTVGTHTITAVYSGATNYAASTGTLSGGQVVNPVQSQTITFNPNPPSSATYNTSFTVAATASSGLPVAFTSTGSCTNSGATYNVNSGSGTCWVIANQAGNAQYSPAPQVTIPVTAAPAGQTITVTVTAPPTATYKSSFTVAATASSGLAVTYSSSGVYTNSGATYTITKSSGTCTVTMTQAGNSNYAAATPAVEHTTVAAAIAPTVSLTAPATAVYGSTYTVVATTNASTTPTITAAPATVCTISGTTVTMVNGTGTCTVTAKWAADDVYKAATATAKTTAQKAATVITWPTPAPITYGTPLSSTQLDATASYNSSPLPGNFVYSPAAGTVPKVGTCDTLKVTFTPTQSTDFTKVTTSVCLQVNAAAAN